MSQKTETTPQTAAPSAQSHNDKLIDLITPLVAPMGYEIVHLEVVNQRTKTLRLFIDFHPPRETAIGIEDCVKVTKALDEPLDQIPEIEATFKGSYELEVSSPGVDRPLRLAKDYERFSGRDVRIHVYRPLSAEELGNPGYQTRNPRQKNFLGTLQGLRGERVLLAISGGSSEGGHSKKKTKKKAPGAESKREEILIPLPLISKANLEPEFDFESEEEMPAGH